MAIFYHFFHFVAFRQKYLFHMNIPVNYPTALRRVQITLKAGVNPNRSEI